MSGRLDSYGRLLKLFADRHGEDMAQVSALIGQGNLAAAEKIVHALKGAAGTVGAHSIHQLASSLDAALKRGDRPAAEAELTLLGERLPLLLAALQAALAEAPRQAITAVPEPNLEQLRLLADFRALLECNDFSARQVLASRRAEFEAILGSECHDALDRAIQRFDYAGALQLLG